MADTSVHAAPAPSEPEGELSIRTLAMPADTNQNGDIFGGWLMSQMDLAGSIFAYKTTKSRNVTVAVEGMTFRKPVYVGDVVSVYATVVRVGRTSITIHVAAWVQRRNESAAILVTDGNYTYVAIDDSGHPQVIKPEPPAVSA
jgi:acyl-CoA thioesterase YciA